MKGLVVAWLSEAASGLSPSVLVFLVAMAAHSASKGSSRMDFSFFLNFFAMDFRNDLFLFMPRFCRCSFLLCSLMTHSRGSSLGSGTAPGAAACSPFTIDLHMDLSPMVTPG